MSTSYYLRKFIERQGTQNKIHQNFNPTNSASKRQPIRLTSSSSQSSSIQVFGVNESLESEYDSLIKEISELDKDIKKRRHTFHNLLKNKSFPSDSEDPLIQDQIDTLKQEISIQKKMILSLQESCSQLENELLVNNERIQALKNTPQVLSILDQRQRIHELHDKVHEAVEEHRHLKLEMKILTGNETITENEIEELGKLLEIKTQQFIEARNKLDAQNESFQNEIVTITLQRSTIQSPASKSSQKVIHNDILISPRRNKDQDNSLPSNSRFLQQSEILEPDIYNTHDTVTIPNSIRKQIRISNSDNSISKKAIMPYLMRIGNVEMAMNDNNSIVVRYQTHKEAKEAIKKLIGKTFKGTKLYVYWDANEGIQSGSELDSSFLEDRTQTLLESNTTTVINNDKEDKLPKIKKKKKVKLEMMNAGEFQLSFATQSIEKTDLKQTPETLPPISKSTNNLSDPSSARSLNSPSSQGQNSTFNKPSNFEQIGQVLLSKKNDNEKVSNSQSPLQTFHENEIDQKSINSGQIKNPLSDIIMTATNILQGEPAKNEPTTRETTLNQIKQSNSNKGEPLTSSKTNTKEDTLSQNKQSDSNKEVVLAKDNESNTQETQLNQIKDSDSNKEGNLIPNETNSQETNSSQIKQATVNNGENLSIENEVNTIETQIIQIKKSDSNNEETLTDNEANTQETALNQIQPSNSNQGEALTKPNENETTNIILNDELQSSQNTSKNMNVTNEKSEIDNSQSTKETKDKNNQSELFGNLDSNILIQPNSIVYSKEENENKDNTNEVVNKNNSQHEQLKEDLNKIDSMPNPLNEEKANQMPNELVLRATNVSNDENKEDSATNEKDVAIIQTQNEETNESKELSSKDSLPNPLTTKETNGKTIDGTSKDEVQLNETPNQICTVKESSLKDTSPFPSFTKEENLNGNTENNESLKEGSNSTDNKQEFFSSFTRNLDKEPLLSTQQPKEFKTNENRADFVLHSIGKMIDPDRFPDMPKEDQKGVNERAANNFLSDLFQSIDLTADHDQKDEFPSMLQEIKETPRRNSLQVINGQYNRKQNRADHVLKTIGQMLNVQNENEREENERIANNLVSDIFNNLPKTVNRATFSMPDNSFENRFQTDFARKQRRSEYVIKHISQILAPEESYKPLEENDKDKNTVNLSTMEEKPTNNEIVTMGFLSGLFSHDASNTCDSNTELPQSNSLQTVEAFQGLPQPLNAPNKEPVEAFPCLPQPLNASNKEPIEAFPGFSPTTNSSNKEPVEAFPGFSPTTNASNKEQVEAFPGLLQSFNASNKEPVEAFPGFSPTTNASNKEPTEDAHTLDNKLSTVNKEPVNAFLNSSQTVSNIDAEPIEAFPGLSKSLNHTNQEPVESFPGLSQSLDSNKEPIEGFPSLRNASLSTNPENTIPHPLLPGPKSESVNHITQPQPNEFAEEIKPFSEKPQPSSPNSSSIENQRLANIQANYAAANKLIADIFKDIDTTPRVPFSMPQSNNSFARTLQTDIDRRQRRSEYVIKHIGQILSPNDGNSNQEKENKTAELNPKTENELAAEKFVSGLFDDPTLFTQRTNDQLFTSSIIPPLQPIDQIDKNEARAKYVMKTISQFIDPESNQKKDSTVSNQSNPQSEEEKQANIQAADKLISDLFTALPKTNDDLSKDHEECFPSMSQTPSQPITGPTRAETVLQTIGNMINAAQGTTDNKDSQKVIDTKKEDTKPTPGNNETSNQNQEEKPVNDNEAAAMKFLSSLFNFS